VSSRGEYFFPVSDEKSQGRADFQSALTISTRRAGRFHLTLSSKGSTSFRSPSRASSSGPVFDYLGEPTHNGGDSTTVADFTDPA